MNLGDEVDLEDYVSRPDKISAAEVSSSARVKTLLHLKEQPFILFSYCSPLSYLKSNSERLFIV